MSDAIRTALSFVPSHDREVWLNMGMAVQSELGDAGFDIWDEWSSQDATYNPRATNAVWKGFDTGGGIGIGTLYFEAQQHGFKFDGTIQQQAPDPAKLAERQRQQRKAEAARHAKADQAAKQSIIIWNKAQPGDHAYCTNKHIEPLSSRVQFAHVAECKSWFWTTNDDGDLVELIGKLLLLPLYNTGGEIRGLQAIDEDGRKSLIKGLGKQGLFIPLTGGKISADYTGKLYIAEGFSTAATLRQATSHPVVAAIDAGNLIHVALAWRQKLLNAEIIIGGDLDKSGTGQRKAYEAALTVGGVLALPPFADEELVGESPPSDWNDYHALHGVDATTKALVVALVAVVEKTSRTEPESLPDLPDVMSFDYDYLPGSLRGYVQDISERMQCPPDFAAVTAYVMMATIIGRKVSIRPMRLNDWTVTPNLWAAVVGNSGVMKSPTTNAVLAPLKQMSIWAFEAFNSQMAEHAAHDELAKLQKSVAKSEVKKKLSKDKSADVVALLKPDACDDAPILKRYMTNNASYESLGEILMENPNGLLVESDELIGLLKQLDAGGQEVARSFYLTAADGDKPYTFDRITRGKGLHIPALCLSIIGGIQPGVLAEYVRQATGGGAGADGLLQRFGLMVYPDISPDWKEIDRYPDGQAREAVNDLVQCLDNLDCLAIGAEEDKFGGVPFIRFDNAAQALFSEWRHDLEVRLRSGEEHPAIVSHLSKYRKLIPSLALINHLCDEQRGAVNESELMRAIAFSEYLESHARRIYSYATRPDIDAAKTLLKRLSSGKLQSPFKTRDIYRAGWTGLETPAKAQSAIAILNEYGHLDVEEIATGGRATTHYHWIKEVTV